MDEFRDLFDADATDNWIAAGIVAASVFGGLVVALWVAGRFFEQVARRTGFEFAGFASEMVERTHRLVALIAGLYFGSLPLDLAAKTDDIARVVAIIALLVQVSLWADGAIAYWTRRREERDADDSGAVSTLIALRFVGRIVLWSVFGIVALDNAGVEVTAIVAGLGIGGIAVALAAQSILTDLFASFAMHLDRPFTVGDFIVIDGFSGTVEHIGVKTTRLQSLDGEGLVFSNSDLINSRIRNFKHLRERRVLFTFGVAQETDSAQLERIPGIVRGIIEAQDETRFDRVHFFRYGDASLDFEVVYFVLHANYNGYMDIRQAVNFAILRAFRAEGIELASTLRILPQRPPDDDGVARTASDAT